MESAASSASSKDSSGSERSSRRSSLSSERDYDQTVFDDDYGENPFRMPQDEKIFSIAFKEEQEHRKIDDRDKMKKLKIWEKGLKQHRAGNLRKIKETAINPSPVKVKSKLQKHFENDQNLFTPIEQNQTRERMIDFIAKKREMFLVQMTLDTKQKEIRRLEKYAETTAQGLEMSKAMLEEDIQKFQEYLNKNKMNCQKAMKNADNEAASKVKKISEIKALQDQRSAIQSNNTKFIEAYKESLEFKNFLDKLAEESYHKEFENFVGEKYKQKYKHYLTVAGRDHRFKNWEDYRKNDVLVFMFDNTEMRIPRYDEEIDNYRMFFEDPQKLLSLFTGLEEKNLFLIQNAQEIDQSNEQLEHEYEVLQDRMQASIDKLQSDKSALMSEINRERHTVKTLQTQIKQHTGFDSDEVESSLRELEAKIRMVAEKSDIPKTDMSNSISLLTEIEKRLEFYLTEISIIEQKDKALINRLQFDTRKERNQRKKALMEEEALKIKEEKLGNKRKSRKKRVGRPIMFRAAPIETKEVKVQKVDNSDDEHYKEYFDD